MIMNKKDRERKKGIAGKRTALQAGLGILLFGTAIWSAPCQAQTIEGLASSVSSQFMSIYSSIGIVVSALATVALAFCAFKWILGTDPQSVRQAKQWMLYIAIGIAVYWLAGVIVDVVKNMASGATTSQETTTTGAAWWFRSI